MLDPGSGAGFDCFLAANQVGPRGKVIGVDMTPEMIGKALKPTSAAFQGAILINDYRKIVEAFGLSCVTLTVKGSSACIDPETKDPLGRAILDGLNSGESLAGAIVSVYIKA